MYKLSRMAQLWIISAILLLAMFPSRAADLTVDGKLNVKSDTVIQGNAKIAGIGVVPPDADLQINQTGLGVGIFLGNRAPFGQALFETDLTAPATHAWFAENGEQVFSVTGGGGGFFKGSLQVKTDAQVDGNARVDGILMVGPIDVGGNVFKPGPNDPPPPKFHVNDNAAIGGDESIAGNTGIHGNALVDGILIVGPSPPCKPADCVVVIVDPNAPPSSKLQVRGNAYIRGDEAIGGNASITGSTSITGDASFGAQVRQMINLWNKDYGIGVQDFAFYERTGNEFFWYKGGKHSKANGDPGDGGTQLMHLGNSGDLAVTGGLDVAGSLASHGVVTPVLQITGGTDVAEPFTISGEGIPKGSVVSIDEGNAGHLKLSSGAYDKRVAGIVSGANGINPGISLSQQGVTEGGLNVALSGRVYVLADASEQPIRPGDLLTTSHTPGRAMKVTDYARAQGAVLGKAMSALKEGKGMVLVLVTLQ